MIIVCEETEVFSKHYSDSFNQLHKMFIRAAEGQHTLYLSEPEEVLDSDFFKRGVAPIHEEEWKEMVQRTAYAPDRENWTIDSESVTEKIHARLSTDERETDEFCLWCILPCEVGNWAEMPLKVLMENRRDWSVIEAAIRVYDKQRIAEAYAQGWLEPVGCGGKGEVLPAIKWQPAKARLAVFVDSDKESLDHPIGDAQEKIKRECERRKIPCHILEKREIKNYIPVQVFEEISKNAHSIQKTKIEEWIRFSDEEKDFKHIEKHFKSREVKSILRDALNLMGTWDKLTLTVLEERAGKELKQMLDCMEEYL